ncbi:MAG: DUF3108 domain-containing protein [Telluria sp.]
MVLCGGSALVHYLAIVWVSEGGAAPPRVRNSAPAPVVARLLAPVEATQAAPPARPAARRKAAATRPTVEAGAPVQLRQVQSGNSGGGRVRYRTSLPPPAELTLDVARSDAQGGTWSGEAVLEWTRVGPAYRLRYSGELAEMVSEGRVGATGITPRTMTEKRRHRARTATHFDEQGNITFSAAQAAVPMQDGAQDRATLPMQLAAIARADAAQLAAGVAIQVGAERGVSVYRFMVHGQEEIDTGMGKLATWRLARVVPPGSYHALLEIWLAPEHEWYPVQLRSTEANGTVTTQTIRKIVVKEAGN